MLIERAFPLSLGIEAPLVTVFLPVLWLIYLLDFWNILVDGLIYWFPSIFGCLASSGWSQGYFLTRVAKSLNTLRKVDPLTFKLKHLCSPTSDSQPPPIIAKPGPLMPINCFGCSLSLDHFINITLWTHLWLFQRHKRRNRSHFLSSKSMIL